MQPMALGEQSIAHLPAASKVVSIHRAAHHNNRGQREPIIHAMAISQDWPAPPSNPTTAWDTSVLFRRELVKHCGRLRAGAAARCAPRNARGARTQPHPEAQVIGRSKSPNCILKLTGARRRFLPHAPQ